MKLSKILVATDFSENAQEALDQAIGFDQHFDAELVLLHAYNIEMPIASPIMGGSFVVPKGFFEEIARQAKAEVDGRSARLRQQHQGLRVSGRAIDEPAAQAIVGEAERSGADLIVMGTRGLTGIKHMALGSVADKVVRTAPCPVLTVGSSHAE